MPEQRPLVLINGQIEQLPNGDTVAGTAELEVPYNKETDFDDVNNFIYKGFSDIGSSTANAAWRIYRIEYIGDDGDKRERYANDDETFSHIWDDRATYTYS